MSLAIVATANTGWSQTGPAGYVDPGSCASCHREIAENYARTGMGRSFRSVRPNTARPEFDGTSFNHAASGQRFTAIRRGNDYYVRRSQVGADSKEANTLEVRADYILGSGEHARSYLRRSADNRLLEFPVSWYAENGGHWEMSPGYDRPGHQGFSREVNYRCMFCHNGYPAIEGRAAEWSGGTDFPKLLPEGIDCQRCHGPGGAHVAAATRGQSPQEVRSSIVNPARLSAERRLEVCMQCHLETTSSPLPGAIQRQGREVFSYRPGQPLGNYILYFDHAPGTGHDDKFEIVSSVYRLRQSACFKATNGRPECINCHDPHRAAAREETLRKSDAVCQGCHGPTAKALGASHPDTASSCTGCHMPQRRAEDAPHILITDHKISARPPRDSRRTESGALPYAGKVALYYPDKSADSGLDLAIAQVKDLSSLPEGLQRLEKALEQAAPASARAHFEMGEALFTVGQAAKALPFFEEAVKRDPREWRYLYKLGQAAQGSGRTNQAVDEYRRALALAPVQSGILAALGSAYAERGDLPQALSAFRQALALDLEDGMAQSNMGNILLRLGNLGEAERALREAVRLRPEVATIRMSLGAALLGNRDKLAESRREFEEAIRAGPSTETARTVWFATLAAGGNIKEAQVRYESSLQSQLAGAHSNLGTVLVALGDSEAAVREYRLALSADPRSTATLVNLALTLVSRGAMPEARQRLEEALRMEPNLFIAHLKLGEMLLAAGQPNAATPHLKRATESSDAGIRRAAVDLLARP